MDQLLRDWLIPEDIISNFTENDIKIEQLKDITDGILKELCPRIGLRMELKKKIDELLFACNTTNTVTDSSNNTTSLTNVDHDLEDLQDIIANDLYVRPGFPDFDLKTLLTVTPCGKSILNYYKTHSILTNKHRNQLTDIIVRHLFTHLVNHKITYEEYNIITAKIIALFPRENTGTYFVPPVKKRHSISGKPSFAKGKLVDKIRNILYKSGEKRKLVDAQSDENIIPHKTKKYEELQEDHKDQIIFLKNNNEPWSHVIDCWKQTFEMRKSNTYGNISDFIDDWNILNDPRSESLINLDFDQLYPEKSTSFFKNWKWFINKIISVKFGESKDDTLMSLNESIQEQPDDDLKVPDQIKLLCYLIPPRGRLNKRRKFSTLECIENFIVDVENPGDIQNKIKEVKQKALLNKQSVQPYLIKCGSEDSNENYYLIIDKSQLWDEFELEDATFAECSINNANHSFQVITASRCLVLCADSRGEMESWAGALRGALHRGADVADLVARLSSGDHHWYAATHARPTFCNVCREPLGALGTAHALACELCKFKAHKRCASRAPPSCKWSTLASLGPHVVEDADGSIIMPHQWLEGNLPVAAKCDVCDKTCGSVLRLQDFRCVWCRKCVHAACKPSWRAACSLGPTRASVVPPTRLHSVGPDDAWVPDRPPNASPLIVFVNSRSGDNQGVKFLRRFKQLLNPAQVFELSGAGPRLGLRLFRHFAPLRVLVCSGDGSVGWVLQEVDKLDMHRQVQTAVLPLGTGNDLARVLGWGASCDDAANLQQLIERYERASTKMLDRWSIMTFERSLSAPPPPPAPPDLLEEGSLLKNLQEVMQAGEISPAASSSLRDGCLRLATVGERAGGGAARAAHRLRRALSLLLHARTHLAHDHHRCKFWEPLETSDSEPEAQTTAEKGSIEKTEKEQLNWAVRGCALATRADSVRRALRSLVRTLSLIYPQGVSIDTESCDIATSIEGLCAPPEQEAAAVAPEGGGGGDVLSLPVPKAFADSRRSSAASAISAASLQPDNIPDVDEDIAKLLSSNPPEKVTLDVERGGRGKTSSASPQDRLSLSNLSSCDTSSCRNLLRPDTADTDRGTYSSTLTIPNLVVSDDSDRRDSIIQGDTYESDQLTIIDIDKPYTDELQFPYAAVSASASGDCTPDRRLSSVDLEIDASSSDGSNISDDYSLMSEIIDVKPGELEDAGTIGHIDSPDDTYVNSETIHGESIMDDISSMLGQDVLLAMMGKNGENETYTDDTTLFTSDTASDITLDSRNPSLQKTDTKIKYISKIKKPKETEAEKFGFENRVFYIENASKVEEQIKYCSLAHFEEGSDIARKSFRKQLRKSLKKRNADDSSLKNRLSKTSEEIEKCEEPPKIALDSPRHSFDEPRRSINFNKGDSSPFPQVSVVVEPPSPSHSDEKKSIKNSRMASVLNDLFDQGADTLSVHTPELNIARERRQSDNPKLLGDPEYGKFLSCSPAATRRISCGSLFKPGEPDKLSTSVSSVWGESGATCNIGASSRTEINEKSKKLPIINPLVQLPAWPHVTQGFISQCLLANADALCAAVSPLMDPDETLLEGFYERAVMNNYFGIGIDAKITLDFHNKREEHPEKCRSRARNYMWYGVLGSKEWVNRTYRHLGQRVQLECDGQRIPLPELQGIVVLNIPSFMGGTNFWGGTRGDDLFLAPSFDDRVLEVVAVFGSAQMAASRLINLQKHRIAQCRAVQINILGEECVPVQVDGEAWLQPPGCVRIIHKNRAQMLCRSRALETSLKTWDEKQQLKAAGAGGARGSLSQSESVALLALLDDVNTLVKHIKLSCISASSAAVPAVGAARRVAAQADALQDADGRLMPAPQLRRLLATLVESCHSLVETGAGGSAGAAVRSALARIEIHDGHAYLLADENPKKGTGRWLRSRRSVSEGPSTTAAQVKSWGVKEVQNWLESLQLGEYSEAFAKHDVTGKELLSLARRDLRDLGVTKVGHVKRILQAVKELQ